MQHSRPHPRAAFEGYYNKFTLPSGATVLIIISKVHDAPSQGDSVSLTYVPASEKEPYHRQHWPESLQYLDNDPPGGFTLLAPDGSARAAFHVNKTVYDIHLPDLDFTATTGPPLPWSRTAPAILNTPASWLANLPLPLQWHVHSLGSSTDFTLRLSSSATLPPEEDQAGEAIVHQEKNWAHSFPSAHVWIQARRGTKGICLAGGQTLGMDAFLLGYRDDDANTEVNMQPPFALGVRFLGLSPFMSHTVDWSRRRFEMTVQSLTQKVVVRAHAPKGTFFALAAPFSEGHRDNWLGQSMKATVEVSIFHRPWWVLGAWQRSVQDTFEGAALEFGGEYYGARGTAQTRN